MNKKYIQIRNSYSTWKPSKMRISIADECAWEYNSPFANEELSRSWASMYVEWWLHNIGYYLTKPFYCLRAINYRCKHVDLEEWGK